MYFEICTTRNSTPPTQPNPTLDARISGEYKKGREEKDDLFIHLFIFRGFADVKNQRLLFGIKNIFINGLAESVLFVLNVYIFYDLVFLG